LAEVEKSLGELAEEINAEHRAFVGTFRKTVEHGIRAGGLLADAKKQCEHGTWLTWLQENFEGALRTAQEYMRLYNHRDEIQAKTRDSAHLSVSGALQEIAARREEPAKETTSTSQVPGRRRAAQRFDAYAEFTETLVEIRESGAWKQSGHESFEAYLQARWNVEPALLAVAEQELNNPVERVRAMLILELYELVPGIKLTPVGIEHIPEDLPFETWRKGLDILSALGATYPDE
jgi:Protein of unknown function (DUF3102)